MARTRYIHITFIRWTAEKIFRGAGRADKPIPMLPALVGPPPHAVGGPAWFPFSPWGGAAFMHQRNRPASARFGANGQPLNLDFETGDLRDWTADGTAFEGQPIRGDTVKTRRPDMASNHTGTFWIGTYERAGDPPEDGSTSAPFKVTQPWASFRMAGGTSTQTRVEIVATKPAGEEPVFKVSGLETETLRPVVVDLAKWVGREIRIRLVDQESGGWGHVNFDDFLFHSTRPQPANELSVAEIQRNVPPPADLVLFAGLPAVEAAAKATLPPGFKMHLFAGEPDVKQPIAFCEDHRGRLWVAEGYTYPRRMGRPAASSGSTTPSADQLKDIYGGKDRILVFEDTDGDHRFDRGVSPRT